MKALLTRMTARALDQQAIAAGVPGLLLMENAGRGATDVLLARLRDRLARPLVLGGTGQNGGDAWVLARRLVTLGFAPRVMLAGPREAVHRDAAVQLSALEGVGVDFQVVGDGVGLDALESEFARATVIVDGLFGTGLDRPITGWRAALITRLAAAELPVLALDLPSGVDADTGAVLGVALPAQITATFAAHKQGLLQAPGRERAGEVVCVDIGVPPPAAGASGVLELRDVAAWIPPRGVAAHKGSAGHVVILAGAPGTSGAALLAGRGALRAGAGLVTLGARADLDGRVVELMARRLDEADLLRDALALIAGKAAAVVGPGLGLDGPGRALARGVAARADVPCVLDADALTALVSDGGLDALRGARAARVLTPHPGEAARLLGCATAEVQADRYAAARALADAAGQVVVLKGAGTIVAAPGGRLAVCPLGTPALAVAGTGDVLAGALGAALTQAPAFEAACAAVLLHARAGELAAVGDRGLLAGEVADRLPHALAEALRPQPG